MPSPQDPGPVVVSPQVPEAIAALVAVAEELRLRVQELCAFESDLSQYVALALNF